MCVRTQRLDVAAVCLGNMGNAMAAKAVRESKTIPQPEARLAILAVHLNMLVHCVYNSCKYVVFDFVSVFLE